MNRLVLDTNIVVSAMLWGGQPRALFDAGRKGNVGLFTSIGLLVELSDVLKRPKFARRLAVARIEADALVAGYASLTTIVRPEPLDRIAPDPDDDVVIATALAAHADHIVTGDRQFLTVHRYQDVMIVDVALAIGLLAPTTDR